MTYDTRVPESAIHDGLSELTSKGIVANWRRTRNGRGRAYRIELASGERVVWEVGKVWTFICGARRGGAA